MAEEVAEQATAENVAEGRHDVFGRAKIVNRGALEPGVAVAVIALALIGVGEDFVGLGGLLEALLGLFIARIPVGMILQRLLAIRFLYLFQRSIALHTENFVKITLRRHRHGVSIVERLRLRPTVPSYQ